MQIPASPAPDATPTSPDAQQPPKLHQPSTSNSRGRVVGPETPVSQPKTPVPAQPDANVTFRRDANGQIYYVITDSQTGKELSEFPPSEVRKVGEGIAEYLNREQQKQSAHIAVKA